MDLNSIVFDAAKAEKFSYILKYLFDNIPKEITPVDELEHYFKTRKKVKVSARDLHAPPNRKRW